MKRLMFLATGVSFLAIAAALFTIGPAFAFDLPPVGYIGLFADGMHNDNSVCPPVYGPFSCWIWCLPSMNGLQAAEFAVSFPPTVVTLATVQNSSITPILCCGWSNQGISVAFGEGMCQMDWVWLYQLTMMSLSATPATIEIIPHPGVLPAPAYQFASCAAGYPIEPCVNLTPLYICWSPDPGPLGVRESDWGAIKSLF
jgi:hypothetical protein